MHKYKILYVFCIILVYFSKSSCAIKCDTKCCENDAAVKFFQEYVRIDTTGGNHLYEAMRFLERQAVNMGLGFFIYYPDDKPVGVMSWFGTNESLPSIMLNSHADVVPAEEKFWTHPPFSAHIDENCNLYGRGTQDTKSVTIQYIEAIRRLRERNVTLERTIKVTVMPDEETGGFQGIRSFIKDRSFEFFNVGFVLDEGLTSDNNDFLVTYQDRRAWQMKFTVFGEGGHGSGMTNSTAMEKIYKLFNIIMKFREEQNEIRKSQDPLNFGNYSSININMISGGSIPNIIPSEVSMVVDMRLAVDVDVDDVQAMVESWRAAAGNDTLLEFIRRDVSSPATPLKGNPYWEAMLQTAKDLGITLKPIVLPATSDMLVLREMGIPALGFAPKVRTTPLLHANNEHLNTKVFLEGIEIYAAMIETLGNLPDFSQGN